MCNISTLTQTRVNNITMQNLYNEYRIIENLTIITLASLPKLAGL